MAGRVAMDPRVDENALRRGGVWRSRRLFVWLVLAIGALWIVSGIRVFDRDLELGVVDGPIPGLFPILADGPVILAPPGLVRLTRYPRREVQVDLPSASEASLPGPDGSRHGLRGSVVLALQAANW